MYMDKKLYYYFVSALILLGLSIAVYAANHFTPANTTLDDIETKEINTDNQQSGIVEGASTYDDRMLPSDATLNSKKYLISSGKVEYQVEKDFIKRNKSIVVGRNNNISGFGWYDEFSNKGALYVNFGVKDFVTDNSKRDIDVLGLFNDLDIQIVGTIDIDLDQNKIYKDVKIPVSLTMNGITKISELKIDILLTDTQLTAKGSTDFSMKDFNITPPSIAGVFNVDEKVLGNFEITAKPID